MLAAVGAAVVICVMGFSGGASAEPEAETKQEETPAQKIEAGVEKAKEILAETREAREKHRWQALGSYGYLDMFIPSKFGAAVSYNRDADRTYEIDYMRGKISFPFFVDDLGEMSDHRLSFLKRSYFGGNSFNLSYGVSYMHFNIHLGNEILSRMSSSVPTVDLVAIDTWGFTIGLGNRWVFRRRFVCGIDWITYTQPVYRSKKDAPFLDYVSDPNDKDHVEKAIDFISYFPRFSLLKVQAGWSF